MPITLQQDSVIQKTVMEILLKEIGETLLRVTGMHCRPSQDEEAIIMGLMLRWFEQNLRTISIHLKDQCRGSWTTFVAVVTRSNPMTKI